MKASAQLYLGLNQAAKLKHTTVSGIIEEASWRLLSKITLSGNIYERLRGAHALVNEVVVLASKVPLQEKKGPPNVHEKTQRQLRRNELSDKTHAAVDEVYELAQSEKLAKENQTRASMYAIIASLATIDALILKDAGEEEILDEIAALREADNKFEEATRELETRTQSKG